MSGGDNRQDQSHLCLVYGPKSAIQKNDLEMSVILALFGLFLPHSSSAFSVSLILGHNFLFKIG